VTRRALRTAASDYGDMPLAVVKAGRYEEVLRVSLWNRTQADLATLSSNAVLVQATGGHFVMNDDPEVLLAAVRAVLASARSGDALPSCRALVAVKPVANRTCPLEVREASGAEQYVLRCSDCPRGQHSSRRS
jgi:hypothetical protein